MRAMAWLVLVSLASGCVVGPAPVEPEPPALLENPDAPAPRSRPAPSDGFPPWRLRIVDPWQPSAASAPQPAAPSPALRPAPAAQEPVEEPVAPPPPQGGGASTPPAGGAAPGAPSRPVRFGPGADAPDGTFLLAWSATEDGGGFAAQLAGVADATLRIDSLARLSSSAHAPVAIALSGARVEDPHVLTARLALREPSGAEVGALDLLQPSPTLSATLQPRASYDLSWTLTLAEGASGDVVVSVRLDVFS